VVKLGADSVGAPGGPTLKEYIAVINKIRKSVILHSAFGTRGYGDFIKHYV
jgi:hypothetical protein